MKLILTKFDKAGQIGMSEDKAKNGGVQNYSLKIWMSFLGLLVVVMMSATGVIYTTHESRFLLNELQLLEKRRNELQVEWGQLLLEQSSQVSQGRVEDRAIIELGMKVPVMENVVVINSD